MTRKFTTSQVVRLLELHPDWEFEAPMTCSGKYRCRAYRCSATPRVSFQFQPTQNEWKDDYRPDLRSDWTRVKPPKAKRERVKVGNVRVTGDNVSLDNHKSFRELGEGNWTIYAVKDGES